jgi:hypothetical protein
MKTILEVCTCRATHLGSHLGSPLGRSKLLEDWQVMPVRYCLNPEYIYQTISVLESINSKTFNKLAREDIHPEYIKSIEYTENLEIDAYLIEISSIKYKDSSTPSGWNRYDKDSFFKNLNYIKELCQNKKIIWISSANVRFTERHMNLFNNRDALFSDSMLISRKKIDLWLKEFNEPTIYPSEIFKDKYAEEVFAKDRDLTHYNSEAEKKARKKIEIKICNLL